MSNSIFHVRPLDSGKGWAIDEYDGRGAWQHSVPIGPDGAPMDKIQAQRAVFQLRRKAVNSETICGTIKVGWSIDEVGLNVAHIQRELTKGERGALYDRIADLVTQAFHQRVTIWIDGEDKPPVDVFLEATDLEIEIDDGPVNGLISDLRNELEEDADEDVRGNAKDNTGCDV